MMPLLTALPEFDLINRNIVLLLGPCRAATIGDVYLELSHDFLNALRVL